MKPKIVYNSFSVSHRSSASPPEGYFPVLDENEKDNLGEKLFFKVQELDAQHCAKVTGKD